jgi:hypothetical protein
MLCKANISGTLAPQNDAVMSVKAELKTCWLAFIGVCGHVQQVPRLGIQGVQHQRAEPGPCIRGHEDEQDQEAHS